MVPSCNDAFLSFELNALSLLSLFPFKVTPQLAKVIRLMEQVSNQGMRHLFLFSFLFPKHSSLLPLTSFTTSLPLPMPLFSPSPHLHLFQTFCSCLLLCSGECSDMNRYAQLEDTMASSYLIPMWEVVGVTCTDCGLHTLMYVQAANVLCVTPTTHSHRI